MRVETERRLLQAAILIACLVPILSGGAGALQGPGMLRGIEPPAPTDLDSHFRYLSGLLLGIGIGFIACVPRIEARGAAFRLLGLVVLAGGLSRAISLAAVGPPSGAHLFGLLMELGTVPLLMFWQWRFAQRWQKRTSGL